MTKFVKYGLATLISPFVIILLTALALYFPPLQNWAVGVVSRNISESVDMDASVGNVRLAFPLNLSVEGVKLVKHDSINLQRSDTMAYIDRAVVNVRLLPLLGSRICVNELEIAGMRINTMDMIPQVQISGNIGRMEISGGSPVVSVALDESMAEIKKAMIDNAHLNIHLTDSVPEDTSTSKSLWRVFLSEMKISNSDLLLHTVGDTLRVGARLCKLTANGAFIDLEKDTYRIGRVKIKESSLQYDNTTLPYSAVQQLDANHIVLDDINALVDSLCLAASNIRLRIGNLALKEKSGLELKEANADIMMDTTGITAGGMIKTSSSFVATQLKAETDGHTRANGAANKLSGRIKARINAAISKHDLDILLNAAGMENYACILPDHPLCVRGTAEGNMNEVMIQALNVSIPTVLAIDMKGRAKGIEALRGGENISAFSASLHADLHTQHISPIVSRFTSDLRIPAMRAVMDADIKGYDCSFALDAFEGKGMASAKADYNLATNNYSLYVLSKNLNVGRFYPRAGIGRFSGKAHVSGQGTDVLSRKTWIKAVANVDRLDYGRYDINNIKATATLKNGRAYAGIDAHNRLMDGTISLDALMNAKKLDATLMTELAYIDLYNLHMVDKPLKVSVCTHLDVMSDLRMDHTLQGTFGDIVLMDSARVYRPDDITLDVHTDRDTTTAKIYCGDFLFKLETQGNYETLLGASARLAGTAKRQFAERTIDQEALREALPKAALTLHSSKDNPIYRFIKYYDIDYDEIDAEVNTSKETGINADLCMRGVAASGYRLDTVMLKVRSSNEPYAMEYAGYVHNVAPNEYVFNVNFDGELLEHGISMNSAFYDADKELGMKLGVEATMVEDGIRLHLTPDEPVIGYEKFKLKKDNYILLGHNNRVFADVDMVASSGTGIMLYSTSDEEKADVQQDITLSVTKLDINRFLSAMPYSPKASGQLDGDFHFIQEADGLFSLSSSIDTRNFVYEGCPVGNLGTDLVYIPKGNDEHYVDGVMTLDDNEIGTIKGTYNFNTSEINADMTLEKFPMSMVNGFVPERIIGLEGYAEGTLSIHGNTMRPDVNGELYLESASLVSVPYGTRMRFDDDPVRIVNSKLLFENFQMYANNNKPLTSYGELDFSDTGHMTLNLLMRAENFLLIDSKETGRSEAYGKAYVNFIASIKGELDRLQVRGKLDVLPTTDIFYILRDSPLSNDNRMKELVKFTDLHTSDSIEIKRPQVDGLNVNFNVNVQNGSHIKCWLNDGKTNYLDIIGEGALQMKYQSDELSMTGRYTISEGEIKYSLPVIPLKTFVISNGSYIEFTGDMMNPKLNITAKETKKASVNVNGTERMVTFNTGVVLSKTLNNMGLEFIIEAPEDNTVSDDLNMKSKEERGKLAVTMLTTGMYLSDGNTSSFSMNSALNSFLQSEINSIAGSALKTLDLSFGMDNSTEEDGTMHTNYSFKFAKRFWNNRLSISVGGKLSTGPDVSGQNKSFFDNVEVQYRLSDMSNKYLNLFYNRSVYDFLEGYVGQYGGGFMWKKKLNSLRDIFRQSVDTIPQPTLPDILHNSRAKRDTVRASH